MQTFEERLKTIRLTKSNRIIAEYCLNNKSEIAFLSAAELAEQVGVSDATVVRFAKSLGYSGFLELKQIWQSEIYQQVNTNDSVVNPVVKFLTRKTFNNDSSNFNFENAELVYMNLIHETIINNPQSILEEAADQLYSSRNKLIVGIRTRSSAAIAFSTILRMSTTNVIEIIEEGYHNYQKTISLSKEDCVCFFTFGRFSIFEQILLNHIKEVGAFLIVVTDKRASNAALASDLLLHSVGDINLPFYSSVGNIVLAECILNIISEKYWEESRKRIRQSEKYLNKLEPKK